MGPCNPLSAASIEKMQGQEVCVLRSPMSGCAGAIGKALSKPHTHVLGCYTHCCPAKLQTKAVLLSVGSCTLGTPKTLPGGTPM